MISVPIDKTSEYEQMHKVQLIVSESTLMIIDY